MPMSLGFFAAGFAEAFRKSRQLRMMQDYYDSMKDYHVHLQKYYDSRSNYYDALRYKVEHGDANNPAVMSGEAASHRPSMTHGESGELNFENANRVYDYLVSKGANPEAAKGFVGSMAHESAGFSNSAYNPDDNGSPSGGWGQWHLTRLDDFTKRAGSDHNKWTADDNFNMFKHEMEDTDTGRKTLEELKNGTTIDDGVGVSVKTYEGASTDPATLNYNRRVGYANQFDRTLARGTATTTPATATAVPEGREPVPSEAKTSTGTSVRTDDQGRAIDPKTGKPTAQADQPFKPYQIAGAMQPPPTPAALPEPKPGDAPIDPFTTRGASPVPTPTSTPSIPIGGGAGNVMEAPTGTVAPTINSSPPLMHYEPTTGNVRGPATPVPNQPVSPVPTPTSAAASVAAPIAAPVQTTLPAAVVANPPAPPVRPADALPQSEARPSTVPDPQPPVYPQPEARPSTVPDPQPVAPVVAPPSQATTPAPPPEATPISNAFTLNADQQARLDSNDPGPPPAPAAPPQMPREESSSAPQQQQIPQWRDDPVVVQPMVAIAPEPQPQQYPQSPIQRQQDQQQDYMQSARGGAVMRYEDAGPVSGDVSGTITGPPPALSGQQQIPPIYYNPATYAAAGAPVGRGISASSIPTYVAAPVPTFTAKGGPVGYARGGEVMRYAAAGGVAPTAAQLADPGWQNTASTYTLPGNAPFTNQQVYDLQNTINSQPYPFLSPLDPSGNKDLSNFYGAYAAPAPAASAPIQPTRVTKTVAPIGGTAVQMQPFTPPKTINSSPSFAPQGSGSNLAQNTNASNPAAVSNPNAANTSANPTLGGGANNSQTDPALAAATMGWVDPNRNRNRSGFARGGIATRFAAAGPVQGTPATMAQLTSPSYVGPTVGGGWVGTPYDQLAPNQQAWADQQKSLVPQITAGGPGELAAASQLTMMPDAVWPSSPVPSAPITPTRVTKTVAPIGGTAVQMQPFTPPKTTNSSPSFAPQGSGSNLAQNANASNPAAVSNPNAANTSANPTLGGGTNNPQIDPALAAATMGWIDPNRNRNWAMGAKSGFRRGGSVMRYADGGDVDVPEPQAEGADETAMPGEPGGSPVPTPSFDPAVATQVAYNTMAGGRMPSPNAGSRMPALRAGPPPMVDPYAIMGEPPQPGSEPLPKGPPPGTPEIVNPQNPSQPSMGVLGAVLSGFQHIVQHSGLDNSGQSPVQNPNDLQDQTAVRRDIALRRSGLTDKQFADTLDRNDPDHQLDLSMRLLGGMEDTYTRFADAGDIDGAMKVSAMIAMKAIDISARYGTQAAKYFRNGDWKTGVEALDTAQGYVPKDTKFQINKINDNGTGVASETDLAGNVIRTFKVDPAMLVAAAGGLANGELGWHAYEAFAMKYLPGIKENMQKEQDVETQRQAEVGLAATQPQYGDVGPQTGPSPQAPASPAPTINSPVPTPSATPAGVLGGPAALRDKLLAPTGIGLPPGAPAPAAPAPGSGQQAANALAPPQVADAGAGPGAMPQPYGPSFDAKDVQYGIPSPSRPDTTTAQPATPPADSDQRLAAQPVAAWNNPLLKPDTVSNPNVAPMSDPEFMHAAQRVETEERNKVLYNNEPIMPNGKVWHRPTLDPSRLPEDPDARKQVLAGLKEQQDEWNKAWIHANDVAKATTASRVKDISDTLGVARTTFNADKQAKAAALNEANKEQDAANKIMDQRRYEGVKPRSPGDVDKTFSEAIDPATGQRSGKSPITYLTTAYPKFATDFGPEGQAVLARAIKTGYAYTNDAGPDDIANLLTGIASGRYGYEPTLMKKDEFDNRYMITVFRPNLKAPDKPYKLGTFVLPVNDGDAVANLRQEFAGSIQDAKDKKEKADALTKKSNEAIGKVIRSVKSPIQGPDRLPSPFMPSTPQVEEISP